MCKLLLIIKYHFDKAKKLLFVHLISYNGCGYTRNELGPCALGFLDNSSGQLKLSKLIKGLPAQQYNIFCSVVGTKRQKLVHIMKPDI